MCIICVMAGKMTAEELNANQEKSAKRAEEISKLASSIKELTKDLVKNEKLTLFTNLLCMNVVEYNVSAFEMMKNVQSCYGDWHGDKYPDEVKDHHADSMNNSVEGLKVI